MSELPYANNRRGFVRDLTVAAAGVAAGTIGIQTSYAKKPPKGSGGPSEGGAWSTQLDQPLEQFNLIPLHAVLLGDGRVLSYGTKQDGTQTGFFISEIWEPGRGTHSIVNNNTKSDIFCSAQIVLPQSGEVLIAGGDIWNGTSTENNGNSNAVLFRPGLDDLIPAPSMNFARWYATPTTLSDGRIFIQGGTDSFQTGGPQPYAEIRDGNTFTLLPGVSTSNIYYWYPRAWVARDGRLFCYSDRTMYYVDPNGSGSLTIVGDMPDAGPGGVTSSEVMYAPGKILRVGGGARNRTDRVRAKDAAATIDINSGSPRYKKINKMPVSLHWSNATVLPDGQVVVTGGSQENNGLDGANYHALLWNPAHAGQKGEWTQGAQTSSGHARLYHSIAMLLPDGSVLVAGGGAPGPQTNTDGEFYYPPYCFDPSGARAVRPTITGAPDRIPVGQTFKLVVDQATAIRRVTLLKTASVTHSFNFEQRFMELPFTRNADGSLQVSGPGSKTLATPGFYMLFAINDQGVPSIGKLLPL